MPDLITQVFVQLRLTLEYDSNSLEELSSCIFYHRDALNHPGGFIFHDYD
jgi:hypothetical protein